MRRPFIRRWFAFLFVCLTGPGCATTRSSAYLAPPAPGGDLVFIANGSGDFRTVTAALSEAVAEERAPLQLVTFDWSHGFGRYLSDHVDHGNQVEQGHRLAGYVAAAQADCPGRTIYLVGHSAGCAVVLAAAEVLPPGSVQRIVLLAPSVADDYDLRPALRCSRQGIDSFSSRRDVVLLGIGVGVVGTADRRWEAAAGRVGFRPLVCSPEDAGLYGKLREHHWDNCVEWAGDDGGHYGTNHATFARAYILPLLTRSSP